MLTGSDRGSIAGGGRYDGLVGMFSGKNIPAVGVSIGIERIFAILERRAQEKQQIRATKTQIFVAQIGKNLTTERMKILGELWNANIFAETLYVDNPKTAKQLDFAFDNGIPLVLWIGEDEVAKGLVKVKNLNLREEYYFERKDGQYIEAIKEQIAQHRYLWSKEEQAEFSKSGGAAAPGKAAGKPTEKQYQDRLAEIEGQLQTTQYIGGQKPSSLDSEAYEELRCHPCRKRLNPMLNPNVFAWAAIVSKFKPEVRQAWPKGKLPAKAS